ncbi:MAG: hypothetical protein LQ338_004520 [Usnochroma carphineum]|nr:MAG: hypothetical protein LQ338_004520 [Usnochroma carphineum]
MCQQCQKRNVKCGGYKKDFKWRAFEESTFTTKPIPSPEPPSASTRLWSITDNPLASIAASMTESIDSFQDNSFGLDGSDPLDEAGIPDLTSPQNECASCLQPSISPDLQLPQHPYLATPQPVHYGPKPCEDYQQGQQALHDCLSLCSDTCIHNGLLEDWGMLYATATSSSTISTSTSPQPIPRFLPLLDFDTANMDPLPAHQPSNASDPPPDESQLEADAPQQDDSIEEILCQPDAAKGWLMRRPSPSSSQTSSSSEESIAHADNIYGFPRLSSRSPEMMLMRFDQQTCGILSVKDGPTENPWRTMIWPLAQASPALYHAIISMTAFHTAKNRRKMRVEGLAHMRKSIRNLANGIAEGSIRLDAALATTLALAFSESWDRHISTGIQHLRGAKAMVDQALIEHSRNSLTAQEVGRLRFLCNTWVYMVVIARLTSVDDDESNDLDYALNASISPFETQHEVDPLMGCASTLFPLIGRTANLVRRVRTTPKNSINLISQANDLKTAVEAWAPPDFFEAPEDQTLDIRHSLDTAEAYRWATLLYLHQAIPEIPSKSSEELAGKVIVYLLRVPLSSRAVIVQIYPLLAAGCEVTSHEDRAWVEDRWAAMMQRMLIGNLDRCWEVVKEVWNRRDADESEKARLALRTVHRPRSSGRRSVEKLRRPVGLDEALLHDDPFPIPGRKLGDVLNSQPIPSNSRRRKSSETIEDLDFERTVRGRLHWVGVMKDWNWEILLG